MAHDATAGPASGPGGAAQAPAPAAAPPAPAPAAGPPAPAPAAAPIVPLFDAGAAPRVRAVCVVAELFRPGTGLASGIDKRPVTGPVRVLPSGIRGDVQGDREHHGGTFKAVYAFAEETRAAWAERLGRELAPGAFGENLATAGIDVDEAVIGSVWSVGGTRLGVTAPRNPCRTFAVWTGVPDWTRTFTAGGRCGAYLRVLTPGEITAGDPILVVEVPDHGVSVGDSFRGLTDRHAADLLDWAVDTGTVLYHSLVTHALGALRRAGIERTVPDHLRSTGRGLGGGR